MNSPQIMIVEDERVVAADLEMRLRRLGYGVPAVVSSGEEALCRAAETNPDLVLMDIMLAGQIDGVETAARIKDSLNIPVVYLTAHGDAATLQRAKSLEPLAISSSLSTKEICMPLWKWLFTKPRWRGSSSSGKSGSPRL